MAQHPMIPDLDADGMLPEGIHPCDVEGLRSRFVDAFPGSRSRALIFTGYSILCERIRSCDLNVLEWINGSFVRDKLDPDDIDVVHFVHADVVNQMPPEQLEVLAQLQGENAKDRYLTHSIWLPVLPEGHPNYAQFEAYRAFYRRWWGRTRSLLDLDGNEFPERRKGYLKTHVGDVNLCPVVSEVRTQ